MQDSDLQRNALCQGGVSLVEGGSRLTVQCSSAVQGRYISIQKTGAAADSILSLCEIEPVISPPGVLRSKSELHIAKLDKLGFLSFK
jgi:hypothetical protein